MSPVTGSLGETHRGETQGRERPRAGEAETGGTQSPALGNPQPPGYGGDRRKAPSCQHLQLCSQSQEDNHPLLSAMQTVGIASVNPGSLMPIIVRHQCRRRPLRRSDLQVVSGFCSPTHTLASLPSDESTPKHRGQATAGKEDSGRRLLLTTSGQARLQEAASDSPASETQSSGHRAAVQPYPAWGHTAEPTTRASPAAATDKARVPCCRVSAE